MKTGRPIKRNEHLKAISRDHHHGLLLCWKIRTALSKKVELQRIKRYTDWFYKEYLLSHFNIEEKYIFPILGNENELVKKAISEHKRLSRLFESKENIEKSISLIEEELEAHIRFEERILFNEVQKIATEDELKKIDIHHHGQTFIENETDVFWK